MEIEPGQAFGEEDIARIEAALGRSLPEDYVAFAKTNGDAFVGGLVDGNPSLPILSFFNPEKILATLNSFDDLKGDGILPFAKCELGNMWVMDDSSSVHYINYYGGRTTSERVDGSFDHFISRIVIEE